MGCIKEKLVAINCESCADKNHGKWTLLKSFKGFLLGQKPKFNLYGAY